jgi:hypothetical protein
MPAAAVKPSTSTVKSAATVESVTVKSTVAATDHKASAVGVSVVVGRIESIAVGIIAISIGVEIGVIVVMVVMMLLSVNARHGNEREQTCCKKRESYFLK